MQIVAVSSVIYINRHLFAVLKDLPLLIEKVVFTIAHNLNLKIA